jgi:alpha-L-rhamnosidase
MRNDTGAAGQWSAPSRFEMGLLYQRNWSARWIAAGTKSRENPTGEQPAPFLRGEFTLPANVVEAWAYLCGLGWHELYINGARVGINQLDPAFARYDVWALYGTHDVSAPLRKGRNALGGVLGTG